MPASPFTGQDIANALRSLGLPQGTVAFSHSNLAYFGVPAARGASREIYQELVLNPILAALGPQGTFVVPTFTYSFPSREIFDPDHTPSVCGVLSEIVRLHPQAWRSVDPIFSVAAIGGRAREMTANVSPECFGIDSFWDRFYHADGVILGLNFGVPTTFLHYVEHCLKVPYRFDKLFPGTFVRRGVASRGAAIYFCRDLSNPGTEADWMGIEALCNERGITRSARVGRGFISLTRAADLYALVSETLKTKPFFLTNSRNASVPPPLIRPSRVATPELPAQASMLEMIEVLWRLPRDIISDGYDAALQALATQLPMTIHEYPTGSHCWTWIVPESWTCHEAYLETLDGRRLLSYSDSPLHVVSYSLPFEGEVSRQELFDHLHVHPRLPEAIPFKFKHYDRDWGLCCSQELKDSLADERYKVVIKSDFGFGSLKVGEVVVPGASEECLVLCARLDHPAQVNAGLSGVVVGMDVMRNMLKRKHLRYTIRFLIVPEIIGSAAFLSHHEHLIPTMQGGLFLNMLGLDRSPTLQLSFTGDTELDRCLQLALQAHDPRGRVTGFQPTNDERQFDAPGVRVPMLALSRALASADPDRPFREHHSHLDNPELVSIECLEDSRDLVLRMIDTFEKNHRPVNTYRGQVFLERYGLQVDPTADPQEHKTLTDVLFLIDGTHTVADIAFKCHIPFDRAHRIVEQLYAHGLVRYTRDTVAGQS